MIKYNFQEYNELKEESKFEYLQDYLQEILSKLYFEYRDIILEQPFDDDFTKKKKLKLLEHFNREMNSYLIQFIQNRFEPSGYILSHTTYNSLEDDIRVFVLDTFEQALNQDYKRFFSDKSNTNIITDLLQQVIIENHSF